MGANLIPFPDKKYTVIYADPPWAFRNKKTGGSMTSGASQKYPTLSPNSIYNLEVPHICADNSILFMWWVASMPEEALSVVRRWGFELKTMTGFVWNKLSPTGNRPHFGMGYYTRAGVECCLIATRGKPQIISHSVRSVLTSPVLEHSKKPDVFADSITDLCGYVPRIELFARDQKPFWDVWGNQVKML